jgi:hypothetical protein
MTSEEDNMKNPTIYFLDSIRSLAKATASVLALLTVLVAVSTVADAQVTVFVPGKASGDFGNPVVTLVPFVPALTVTGPGTIQITYVSGMVQFGIGLITGPNGAPWDNGPLQTPLQEANGVAHGHVNNLAALIGAFVPKSRVDAPGFQAIDGTKNLTPAGIVPGRLFFIGTSRTIHVNGAGTLFLGINDEGIEDNGGGFMVQVQVTGP